MTAQSHTARPADTLPVFEPLMLSSLAYRAVQQQMKLTGCAARRPHWCNPVLVLGPRGGRWLDDEGELRPYVPTRGDADANDWMMVPAIAEATGEAGQ